MKKFFLILILFVAACEQSNEQAENLAPSEVPADRTVASSDNKYPAPPDSDESIYEQYIPQKLSDFLSEEMPDWKIPAPDKWDKHWFDEYKTANELVNFVSGDFNCDRRDDYALILSDEKDAAAVWVFLSTKNGFEKIKLDEVGGGQIEIGIGLFEPQTIENDWTTKPVKINCQAIEVGWFEKASEVYYREKGVFKSVTTGD